MTFKDEPNTRWVLLALVGVTILFLLWGWL